MFLENFNKIFFETSKILLQVFKKYQNILEQSK